MADLVPRKLCPSLPAFDPLQRPKERAEALAQWWHERALVRFVSDGTRQLWHQLRGETDDEFASFGMWYETQPRPEPAAFTKDPALVIRNNWQNRANALDRYLDVCNADGNVSRVRLAHLAQMSLDFVRVEFEKLRNQALSSDNVVGDSRDLMQMLKTFIEISRNAPAEQPLVSDVLTPEENDTLLALCEKLEKGTKR